MNKNTISSISKSALLSIYKPSKRNQVKWASRRKYKNSCLGWVWTISSSFQRRNTSQIVMAIMCFPVVPHNRRRSSSVVKIVFCCGGQHNRSKCSEHLDWVGKHHLETPSQMWFGFVFTDNEKPVLVFIN